MKARPQATIFRPSRHARAAGIPVSRRLNQAIAPLGTLFLVAGAAAISVGGYRLADYMFATGMLLHLTAWFEDWWVTDATARAPRHILRGKS